MQSKENPDREPHNDSMRILVEMRGFRDDLTEVKADLKILTTAMLGDQTRAGIFEQIRQMKQEQKGLVIRMGAVFGFLGTCAGWLADWWFQQGRPH